MTAGKGTPFWIRLLRVASLLLGIVSLILTQARTLAEPAASAMHRLTGRTRFGHRESAA
ncbi:hypothetical protein [Nocardia sp. alder85J]|uniref:hypothetical protein n=1 Tax=Nocardia sp. alder85J TaxID=2862949 RepID=UPI001CD5F396|nr:hypothetical protein [Nocardia sp. alder85J]MCX4094903.1 hypothetical protein [Nocardia sp. alder85J]